MENEIIYNLVLELRNNDYNVVEIGNISGIEIDYPHAISYIDAFTMQYSEEELKKLIEKNNMVSDEYLKGKFKVISNLHHKLPAIMKSDLEVIDGINNNEIDLELNIKDKLYGYYKKILEKLISDEGFYKRLKNFKKALNNNDYNTIFYMIKEIPYAKSRSIYVMLSSEITKKRQEEITRKLEKLDDVA